MTTHGTSPAKKTFRVYADELQRVFQDIETATPEEAHAIAEDREDDWELCDRNFDGLRICPDVKDLETDESHRVGKTSRCRNCNREIVDSINDSHFHHGECGPCEYLRYKSQPKLLAAGFATVGTLSELSAHWCFRWGNGFKEAFNTLEKVCTAINYEE